MRNRLSTVFILLILTITIQHLAYLFFDWKAGQLLNPTLTPDKRFFVKTEADMTQAVDFQLSYNNNYLGLSDKDSFKIIDLYRNSIIFDSNRYFGSSSELLAYRWLPDRNSLLFFLTDPGQPGVSLYSLDLNDHTDHEYRPKLDREFGFAIKDIIQIEMSTYTNNLYMLYEDDLDKRRLIKVDIMKNINWLDLPQEKIHNIAVSNKYGYLFAESSLKGSKRIILFDGRIRKIINAHHDIGLLGCRDNIVYLGSTDNGNLQELFIHDHTEEGTEPIRVWEGQLAYNNDAFVTRDKRLIIRNDRTMNVFSAKGMSIEIDIPANNIILSPVGSIYLEVIPRKDGLVYFWRIIPDKD